MDSADHDTHRTLKSLRLSLETPVERLRLPSRGRNALRRLHVLTLRDFIDLDLRLVGTLRDCGTVTIASLRVLRDELWKKWLSQAQSAEQEQPRLPSELEQIPSGTDERQIQGRLGLHTVPEFLDADFKRLARGLDGEAAARQRPVQIQGDLPLQLSVATPGDLPQSDPGAGRAPFPANVRVGLSPRRHLSRVAQLLASSAAIRGLPPPRLAEQTARLLCPRRSHG